MFGGIARSGPDRILYATREGSVLTIDLETGRVAGQFSLFPSGPRSSHVAHCAVDADGTVLLADALHRCVRRFSRDGTMRARYGGRPTPGMRQEDHPGTLTEPGSVLPVPGGFVVASGGDGLEHAVQRFGEEYEASLRHPFGPWRGANGLALVDGEVWVAETEGGGIRRFAPDGRYAGSVPLEPDLQRPFRIADDEHGQLLLLLAPETKEEQEVLGVARIGRDGEFGGWAVEAGEDRGVYCPFDVAVLDDGRFVVADLPFGVPPDVRLQLFAADGRLLRTILEDRLDLEAAQRAWFQSVLARTDGSAATLHEQARVHHHFSGGGPEHWGQARRLYRAALDADPHLLVAHLGLASLLQEGLREPEPAEEEYQAARGEGGEDGEMLARIAECRHQRGDIDGAIRLLREAVEASPPPEDYERRLDELGTYYLERAGEHPETMI